MKKILLILFSILLLSGCVKEGIYPQDFIIYQLKESGADVFHWGNNGIGYNLGNETYRIVCSNRYNCCAKAKVNPPPIWDYEWKELVYNSCDENLKRVIHTDDDITRLG